MQAHLGEWPGPIIEDETDEVVAFHKGFWFYTVGQRSGLDLGHLDNGPWCVLFFRPITSASRCERHVVKRVVFGLVETHSCSHVADLRRMK